MQNTLLVFDADKQRSQLIERYLTEAQKDSQVLLLNTKLVPDDILKNIKVDCLILSHSCLPKEGLDAVKKLKLESAETGIILLANEGEQGLIRDAFKAGIDDYLDYQELTYYRLNRTVDIVLAQKHVERQQRKSAAELLMLRSVVDHMPNLLMICDPVSSQFITFNLALNRFLKLTHEQIKSRSYADISQQFLSHSQWLAFVETVRATGHYRYETELTNGDGEKVPFEFDTFLTEINNKEYLMLSGMDISRLKEVQLNLLDQARRDPLTHLRNRRGLSEDFINLYKNSARNHECICLALFDIDNFKTFNDNFGHDVGDDILIQFADVLRAHIQRPLDIIARAGGEEFFILISGSEADALKEIVEMIVTATASQLTPAATVSAGGVIIEPWLEKVSFTSAYKRADNQLYEAKTHGKNQARFYCKQNII